MQVSITVVIPTFERPTSTVRAVESALEQTRKPEHIIVVDDGSSDHVRMSLEASLSRLPVTILTNPHCGHPGRVRNFGVQRVETTHVAFLDSDDVWVRNKLELQSDLARQGARAQGSAYCLEPSQVVAPGTGTAPSVVRISLNELLRANQICNSSVLLEMNLLREIGGLATSYAVRGIEDYATWLRVATIDRWHFCEAPLVVYADNPLTSMRSTNEFTVSEKTLALWDLAGWLNSRGKKIPNRVRLGMGIGSLVLRNWAGHHGADS